MAQWAKLSELCRQETDILKHITAIFLRVKFPFDIRHKYAVWIESQPWLDLNTDFDDDNAKGEQLYTELLEMLERDQAGADFHKNLSVEEQKSKLKELAEGQISEFIKAVQTFLREELVLIQSVLCSDDELARRTVMGQQQAQPNEELNKRIRELDEKIRVANKQVQVMREKQDQMIVAHEDYTSAIKKLKEDIENPVNAAKVDDLQKKVRQFEQEVMNIWQKNYQRREGVKNTYLHVATDLTLVLKQIWQEVDKWKHDKKLDITGLSKPKEGAVDLLNDLCEEGGRMLMNVIQEVQTIHHTYQGWKYRDDTNEQLMSTMLRELEKDYLCEHLKRVFVVDRHPKQVLKVNGSKTLGFSMSVRILGGNSIALAMNPPKVTAKLFHERTLVDALKDVVKEKGVCHIVNGTDKAMEYQQKANKVGQWVCNFSSVQLTKVRRVQDKANDELVTGHKYGMIFYTEVTIREKVLLQVLSLPIVLTSQTSQECMAKGTLIWDGAFSAENRAPYQDPDEVEWNSVAVVLDALFRQNTGRGLTKEHLMYLARLAFRDKRRERRDFSKDMISKSKLIKDKLPHREFSFWKWFYCCMNLIREHLKKEWSENLIYGFLSKEDAVSMLIDKPCGTFLLRFSETDIENSQRADICGHLTVAVKEVNPETANPKVYYVKEHLSPKDLHEKGLAAILEAFQVDDPETNGKKRLLTSLWPGRDFAAVFQHYIAQKEKEDSNKDFDYKRAKFRIEIELGPSKTTTMNGGATPTQNMTPLSPISSVMSPRSPMVMDTFPGSPSIASDIVEDMVPMVFPQSPFPSQASPPVAQVAPMGFMSAQPEFPAGVPPVAANVAVERVLDASGADITDQDQQAAFAELLTMTGGNDQETIEAIISHMSNMNGMLGDDILNSAEG